MNPGLMLYHQGAINAHLDSFELVVFDPQKSPPHQPGVFKLASSAEEAIRAFCPAAYGITWLSGPAATKKLAKAFGLQLRKRAPGGGRRKKKEGDKSIEIPIWMTPAGFDKLELRRGKVPRGKFVESLL